MNLPDKSKGPADPKNKNITPVVKGATPVKHSSLRQIRDSFIAESPRSLVDTVLMNVVIPRLKAGVEEALNSFLAGILWGNSTNRPQSSLVSKAMQRGGVINYSAYSSQPSGLAQARALNTTRSAGNYRDLVLPSQDMAEILLANMFDLLSEYRVVAVADLYELAEITPQPSDNAYGWMNLDGARISKVRDGYLLELPRPGLIS